jgi:hypothetical protein
MGVRSPRGGMILGTALVLVVDHKHVCKRSVQILHIRSVAPVLMDDEAVGKGLQDRPLLLNQSLDLQVVYVGFLVLLLLEVQNETGAEKMNIGNAPIC